MKDITPFVSVIIPVFNDSQGLRRCLTALFNQSYSRERYEVIVADNGSSDDIEAAIREFDVVFVSEKTPSSYAARNRGISVAKGEILAFTDADCIPASDWLEMGVKTLTAIENCGLVGGKIEVIFNNPLKPNIAEIYDQATAFPQKRFIEADNYAATANVFTFRKVIDQVGSFDGTLKSNGDRELGNRVFSAGFKLAYSDDVQVTHPARSSSLQILKKYRRLMGGQHDLAKKNHSYPKALLVKKIIYDLEMPIAQFVKILSGDSLGLPYSNVTPDKLNTSERLELIHLILRIKFTSISERAKLLFGSTSQRA